MPPRSALFLAALLVVLPTSGAGDSIEAPAELPPALAQPGCVACNVDGEAVRRSFSAERWSALEAGEIPVTQQAGDGPSSGSARAVCLLPYRPEQVWQVLVDYNAWTDFLPATKASRIEKVEGNAVTVRRLARYWVVDVGFTIVNTLSPDVGRVEWRLDPEADNDIASTEGYWELVPIDAGERTLIRYLARAEVGYAAPQFLRDLLTRLALPGFFQHVSAELARRFPQPDE